MEAHLAPNPPVQVNKIASSYEICCVPHDAQYYMENPEKAFVDYPSSHSSEVGGKPFTTNQRPRNFNEAANAWKDKPNLNWARTQNFSSPQNGTFSTYSSNMPNGPSNYQTKLERVLNDFDSHQEKRLSSLRTQLKQQQDEVINKFNTLWKVVSEKFNNPPAHDVAKYPTPHINVVYHAHHENGAPPNKGINSPSKLLSLKYQSQSSPGEQNRNSSSLKRVYFVNTITVIRKEDESRAAGTKESDAAEDKSRNIKRNDPEDRTCGETKEVEKVEKESEESEEEIEEETEEEEEDDPEYFVTFPTIEELGRVKGLKVFVGNFTYECDFVILEDTTSVIDHYLGGMVLGNPFVKETGLVYIKEEETVMFEKGNDDDHEKTHYSDSLNLGPTYKQDESVTKAIKCLIKMKSRKGKGGVTLYLIRISFGVLRSFIWTILG
ncbi:hypothetical protein Tco_0688250 [Tanacetum coccineum]